MAKLIHRGLHSRRTEDDCHHGRLEKTFAEEWEKEQHPPSYINYGVGVLMQLITARLEDTGLGGKQWVLHPGELTQRDAEVAATVIQWLGTNCGFCWLEETLKKCGYKLVRGGER